MKNSVRRICVRKGTQGLELAVSLVPALVTAVTLLAAVEVMATALAAVVVTVVAAPLGQLRQAEAPEGTEKGRKNGGKRSSDRKRSNWQAPLQGSKQGWTGWHPGLGTQ
jgi:hypothetical protein